MARVKDNPLTKGTSGAIGKDIVYRVMKKKTFSGKFPDMSAVIPSKNQTKGRELFAEAVEYAKSVMKDPEKSEKYKTNKSQTVYHAAIKDYMSWFNQGKPDSLIQPAGLKASLQALSLAESQLRALIYIQIHKKLTNRLYRKLNAVSKATATRHLQELADLNIIESNKVKGAGAHYILGSGMEGIGSSDKKMP